MKNIARAFLFGSLLLPGLYGAFACWPNAPIDSSDASTAITIEAGIFSEDSGPQPDAGSHAGDAGDGGDAASDASTDALPPTTPAPSTVIAAGIGFGCRISGGNVYCWGNNSFGQAGVANPYANPTVAHPTQVAGIVNAIAIALGDNHACAVTSSNAIYCWGLNNSFQLGHTDGDQVCPATTDAGSTVCNSVPEQVDASAIGIAASGAWTCAVTPAGAVQCWGAVQTASVSTDPAYTGSSPCGLGATSTGASCFPAPYTVPSLSGVIQLALGYDHACAVLTGNAVWCWGANDEGQVQEGSCNGLNKDCVGAVASNLPASLSVGAGTGFTCTLGADAGTVSCVGDNAYGEIGQGASVAFNPIPSAVAGLGPAIELVAGGGQGNQAACAILDGGLVECWGNVASEAGVGVPTPVAGLPLMNALGVPDSTYECGIANDHSIWCWDLATGAVQGPIQ